MNDESEKVIWRAFWSKITELEKTIQDLKFELRQYAILKGWIKSDCNNNTEEKEKVHLKGRCNNCE